MSCPFASSRYEPIADELEDKSLLLYPHHTVFTHMGCVLIRSMIGITLMSRNLNDSTRSRIMFVMIMALIIFGSKYVFSVYMNDVVLWKSYPRMLVAYTIALYLVCRRQENLAGLIIVVDAIIAVQSRHTSSVLSYGMKKKKPSVNADTN